VRTPIAPVAPVDPEILRAGNPLFAALGVHPQCLGILKSRSITEPMPIQTAAIPIALEGRDMVAIAQTGTGKTLAFGLPLLSRLVESKKSIALVLAPTRELAQQIYDVLKPMASAMRLNATCIYGGVGMENQNRDLHRGNGLIVATPGRLLDHMERGHVHFDNLTTIVLDEADRMLDMGFLPDIRWIMGKCPPERQTLMFSATFPTEIARLTKDMLRDPQRIEIGRIAKPAETVRQCVYTVQHESKLNLLAKLLEEIEMRSSLVFVRTKRRADLISKALLDRGMSAEAIHGGRSQGQRQRAIDAFSRGRCKVLVATDVAARGIDVRGITHVVNFDIPANSDDYIHRIGRTARANAEGDAITFVCPDDSWILRSIEEAVGHAIDRKEWEGAVKISTHRAQAPAPAFDYSEVEKRNQRSRKQRSGKRTNAYSS
jgi:ATP-dependent RNA helicase RhlE